jgi:hypothetical protein
MKLDRGAAVTGVALGLLVGVGATSWRTTHGEARAAARVESSAHELHVPRQRGSIVLDGDTDDPGWRGPLARTGAFIAPAGGARPGPYTDARFVWGDGTLYAALYAGDVDIRASAPAPDEADPPLWLSDAFRLTFGPVLLEASALGALTDARMRPDGTRDFAWDSGVHVSHEIDGTVNDPSDEDEEWVLELAIPLEALGLRGERGERVPLGITRCDVSRSGRICMGWGDGEGRDRTVLVLD